MKKFFTQKINISYAIITVLVLVLGVSQTTAQYAQPGDVGGLNPLIHRGGGEQSISELRLGDDLGLDVGLDARGGAGFISWFDDTASSSVFATLQNSFLLGRVFIGQGASPTLGIWNTNQGTLANPLLAPLQKVNVHGNTLATNLQNTSGNAKVCVTNAGALVLCPETTYYEYQCDYSSNGEWSQPGYGMPDGTNLRGGVIQGGVLVFNDCPAIGSPGTNSYDSNASYSTGDNVCSASQPSGVNCIQPSVPAFVCGGLTPGEWNPTGYGAQTCPYQNYSGSGLYNQGDTVCSPDGSTPSNGTCTAPTIPAYTCQSSGTWVETGYGAPTCPYANYSGSAQYSNGDNVCSSSLPSDTNCTAASNGVCGLSDGGTFSSTPSSNLCSAGLASVVSTNTSTTGSTTGSCVGTYNTYGSNVSLNIDLISNTGSQGSYRDQLYSITGTPEAGQIITWTVYSYSNTYTVQAGDTIDSIGAQMAAITNNTTAAQWRSANPASYGSWTQGNPVGFEPTGTYNSSTNRLNLRLNWQNQFAMSLQGVEQCSGATSSGTCTAQSSSCNWLTGSTTTTVYEWNCTGSNGGTTDSCSATYSEPVVNAQCATFSGTYSSQPANAGNACISGSYSDTSDLSSLWRWSCVGSNGGTSSSCNASRVSYSWNIGSWGTCNGGNQNRSVTCQNNSGNTVSNSLCPPPTPSTTRSCSGGPVIIDDGMGGSCDPIMECCQPDGSGGYIPGPPCA